MNRKSMMMTSLALGLMLTSVAVGTSVLADNDNLHTSPGKSAWKMFSTPSDVTPADAGKKGEHRPMLDLSKIKRTVENTAQGVVITLTSDDATIVAKLQEKKDRPEPKDSKITHTEEKISNGVKVTISSTDADTAKKVQEREDKGGMMMGKMHGVKEGFKMMKDVKRTVTELDNGISFTLTSDNKDIVAKLQSDEHKMMLPQADDKITFKKESIENGVKITITSTDAATSAKIKEHKDMLPDGKKMKELHNLMGKVQHSSTNIDGGVVLTLTSDDQETVTFLQSHDVPPMIKKETAVTTKKESIDKGVRVTITSTDPAVTSKIQKMSTKPEGKEMGKRGFGGKKPWKNNADHNATVQQ